MENNTLEATVNAVRFFLEEKDHISTELTVTHPFVNSEKRKIESGISNYVKEQGGPSVKVTKFDHSGGSGGWPDVTVKGHVSHVMKLVNTHHGENYSTDHAGHAKYKKDFGESVEEAAAPTYGMDAVRRAFHKNKIAPHSDGNTSSNAHNELAHYHMNKASEAKGKEAKKAHNDALDAHAKAESNPSKANTMAAHRASIKANIASKKNYNQHMADVATTRTTGQGRTVQARHPHTDVFHSLSKLDKHV